jgi:hypothetical protein
MTILRRWAINSPRSFSAVAFGITATIAMHLAWIGSAATSGLAPWLTIAAGAAHAAAGAITGRRLLDNFRTRSRLAAAFVGAGTSLIALAVFSPLFAAYLMSTNGGFSGAASYVLLPLFTAFFAFLAAGWALLVVSMGVGCALHAIAIRSRDEPATVETS